MCKQPNNFQLNLNPESMSAGLHLQYRRKLALKIKETLEQDD